MINKSDSDLPKYQQIKNYILDLINKKELAANDRIPSETELSKELGYSVITVRRALSELVNEGVIYRIQGKGSFVAEKKDPETKGNEISSRLVAFVLASNESYDGSFMQMTRGMQSYLNKHGYSLIIEYTDENIEKEKEILKRLASSGISGIIIFSINPDEIAEELMNLKKKKIPFVMLDRYVNAFSTNYVVSDNFDGAYNAVQHLIEQGHTQIAFLGYRFFLSSEIDRYKGYVKAMENAGIKNSDYLVFKDAHISYDKIIQMIKNREITALLAVNDTLAIDFIKVCEKNSIKVPDDVSVMGFDDIDSAQYQKVPLSTVKQYFHKMGHEAARVLIRSINDPELGSTKVHLPVKVICRESTAAKTR